MPIDIKSARRRLVAFSSLAEVMKDLETIESAQRSGRLKRLGNHEAGAIFEHLASTMERSFDGFPVRVGFPLSVIGTLVKKSTLKKPFQPGIKLKAEHEKHAWNDAVTFEDGLTQLRAGIGRAAQPGARPTAAHPFFGVMTPEEWGVYHLRHAELHLSFLDVGPVESRVRG